MASLSSIKQLLESNGIRIVSLTRLARMSPREKEDLEQCISDTLTEIDKIMGCARKRPYSTPEHAERARLAMESKTCEPFDVYRCRYEEHWHVGHRNPGL